MWTTLCGDFLARRLQRSSWETCDLSEVCKDWVVIKRIMKWKSQLNKNECNFLNFFPWDIQWNFFKRIFPFAGETKLKGGMFMEWVALLLVDSKINYNIFIFSINTFISFISYKLSYKLQKAFGDSTGNTNTKLNSQRYQKPVLVEKRYSVSRTSILVLLQGSLHQRVREVIYCSIR